MLYKKKKYYTYECWLAKIVNAEKFLYSQLEGFFPCLESVKNSKTKY